MELLEIQQLKNKIDEVNNNLIAAGVKIESAKKRQSDILEEYKCTSEEELRQLLNSKEQELDKLVEVAKNYVSQMQTILREVENINGI